MSSKVIITIAIAALLSVSFAYLLSEEDSSASVGETFTVGSLNYQVTREDGLSDEVKVTGFSGDTVQDLEIPLTVTHTRTYKVTAIGASAFAANVNIRSVDLNDVKDIGALAFSGCVSLTEVEGEEVTDIGESSFSGCIKLEEFTGNKLKVIGISAFTGCIKLDSINLANVTRVWDFSFMECRALETVNISKMIYIGSYAFYDTGLTSITIPITTIQIGGSAFNKCSSLATITSNSLRYEISNGALVDKTDKSIETLPQAYSPSGGHYIISNGIEKIDDGAFDGCDKLVTVRIPSSVEVIGDGAFRNCPNLEVMEVAGGTNFRALNNCLYSYDRTEIYFVPQGYTGEYVAPDALTTVKPYSFADCTGITSVDIRNVTTIGKYAFSDCYGMKTMYVNKDAAISVMSFDLGSIGHTVDCDIRSTGVDFIGISARNAYTNLTYYLPVTFTGVDKPATATLPGTEYVEKNGTLNLAAIKADLARYGFTTLIDGVLSEENMLSVGTTAHTVTFQFDGTEYYILTFETDGGYPLVAPLILSVGEAIPEIILPEKEGYDFVSWSPAIPSVMPANNLTITAVWIKVIPKESIVTDGDTKKVSINDSKAEMKKDVIDALKDGSANVQISVNNVGIKMDTTSFGKLAGTDKVTVSVNKSTGLPANALQKLSDSKKKIAEKASVFDISFTTTGSTSGLGTVTLTLPYTSSSGSTDKITVYYVTDSGDLEELVSQYSNGVLTAEVSHFSVFAVTSESLTADDPSSGGMNMGLIIGIAVGAIVLIGAAVLIMKRR